MNKIFYKEEFWIGMILLASLLLYSSFLLFNPVTLWDENVYLSNARGHIATSNFGEDFRFPLLEFLIGGIWLVSRESLLIARLLMILFSLGSVLVFYLLSKELFQDKRLRISSTVLFAFSSLMVYWSFRVYTDIPAIFSMLASIWLFFRFLETKKYSFLIFSGVLSAFAFLFRFPIILFATVLGVYLLIKKLFKPFIIFVLAGVASLIPWFIYNFVKYGNPIWDLVAQGGAVASYTSSQPVSLMIHNVFFNLGIILLGLIPFLIWIFLGKKQNRFRSTKRFIDQNKMYLLLGIFVLEAIFYLFIVRLKLSRYILSLLPFLILFSVAGVFWFSKQFRKYNKIILVVILSLFVLQSVFLGFSAYKKVSHEDFCRRPLFETASYLESNFPKNSVVLSNCWPWFGYYDNFKVSSIWTSDMNLLIKKIRPDLVVIDRWSSDINRSIFLNDPRFSLIKNFSNSCGNEVLVFEVDK